MSVKLSAFKSLCHIGYKAYYL